MNHKRPKKMPPIHPGEILHEEFLKPLGISQYRLAKAIHVPPIRISEIVRGKRSLSADTALRLAHFFGTSAEVWLNLQKNYDLQVAKSKFSMKVMIIPLKISKPKSNQK